MPRLLSKGPADVVAGFPTSSFIVAALSAPVSRGTDAVNDDYDFSKADRGRFYRSGAVFSPPVHLEPELPGFLQRFPLIVGHSLMRPATEAL